MICNGSRGTVRHAGTTNDWHHNASLSEVRLVFAIFCKFVVVPFVVVHLAVLHEHRARATLSFKSPYRMCCTVRNANPAFPTDPTFTNLQVVIVDKVVLVRFIGFLLFLLHMVNANSMLVSGPSAEAPAPSATAARGTDVRPCAAANDAAHLVIILGFLWPLART